MHKSINYGNLVGLLVEGMKEQQETINKLNREGVRRGFSQGDLDELSQLSLEQIQSQYAETLNRLSPGLLDQMDELIVKVRDLDAEIAKGSSVDTSGIVKVTFADEIQSDIMQAAAGRKQKLLATLRKISEEGRESTTLPELDRIGNEALAFFEENKSKADVSATESGLQYRIIKSGAGQQPAREDLVTVHYHGTLPDGTIFDSSYQRGEPVTFPLNRVIAGWSEALQLMKEGDKWELYIPSHLAYGPRGAGGQIGPNQPLVFEVELIKVQAENSRSEKANPGVS